MYLFRFRKQRKRRKKRKSSFRRCDERDRLIAPALSLRKFKDCHLENTFSEWQTSEPPAQGHHPVNRVRDQRSLQIREIRG